MNKFGKLLTGLGIAVLLHAQGAWAANCVSRATGNWNSSASWSCNGSQRLPNSGDAVTIAQNHTITLNQDATVQDVTINNGGVLKGDNSGRTLNLTESPAFTVVSGGSFDPGNSTVVINQSSNTTLTSGAVTFHHLSLSPQLGNNHRTYTFGSGAVTVNGNLSITPSRPQTQSRTLTVNMNGGLTVLGTTTIRGTGSANAVLNTGSNALTLANVVIDTRGTLTTASSAVTVTGNFTNNGTFTTPSGTATFAGTAGQTISGTEATTFNNLRINNGSGVSLNAATTVAGTLTLSSGAFNLGASTLSLNGPAISGTPSNMASTSASSLVFGGSASGVSIPSSVTTLSRLTVGNANGVTLNADLSISTGLALESGPITTGARILTLSPACNSGALTRNGGYVLGNLRLTFPSGSNINCTYHVGSAGVYAPIGVSITSGGGTLTGSTTGADHPQISTSEIIASKTANRYWTLGAAGDTIVVTSYGATFNYLAADLDADASPSSFVVGQYSGGTWSLPTSTSTTTTSTSVSGISGNIARPTDFAVGQTDETPCTVPTEFSAISGMTCVCDNFGRASLNPSTINGGNWAVSHSSGTFGDPRIVNANYLRLTDNSTNVATVATLPGTFPAAGNLISIDFKHYAYKGTILGGGPSPGADGIAVTLSDSSIIPKAGAYGGSLGYAQKTGISGFAGGWIGIGFDEYGNYSNSTEGRGTGVGTGLIKDAIAARGSGTGSASGQYPYLAGTGTSLSPGIDDPNSATAEPGHAYRITVDARNYTASNKKTQVNIYRDTTGAGNFSSSLLNFDVYQKNPSQAPVPANWKISFTGSTGDLVNVHEISAFRVCATSITFPPEISIDDTSPSTCNTQPKGKPTVTLTAKKANGTVDTAYNKTVVLNANLANGTASNAVFTLLSGTAANWNAATRTYQFSAADQGVAKFTLTDTTQQDVYITVTEVETNQTRALSTPVQFKGASFTIGISDALGAEVVAGRPHLMTVTRNSGCSVDTTGYNGAKNLDGWYAPDASNPDGALAPKICAPNSSGTCFATDGTGGGIDSGSCPTLSDTVPAVNSSTNNLPSLTFTNGVAKFCLMTFDVGRYTLNVRDDVTSSTAPIIGTSALMTVRPFAVVVSGITGNPAANAIGDVNTSRFKRAGESFTATVGGYRWTPGASTASGAPVAAAGFSALTAGGLAPSYADTVTLSATTPVQPSPGVTGVLGNGSVAVNAGTGTVNNLSYSEVGSFTLAAAPSASYLGSGINLASKVAIFSRHGSNSPSSVIGRFYPSHFTVSASSIVPRADIPACSASSFTYMDEPMKVAFTLTAKNLADATTYNYKGAFALLDVTSMSSFKFGAINNTTNLTSRLGTSGSLTVATGGWNNGVADVTSVPLVLTRPASAATATLASEGGPYANFRLGIAPTDGDGVSLKPEALTLDVSGVNKAPLGGAQKIYLGRLRLSNAHGSELLKLPLPLEAQYWNGTGFITNVEDSCTNIAGSSFVTSSYKANLAACESKVPISVTLDAGKATLLLTAPGAGNNGSMDLSLNLGATASGDTCTTGGTTTATAESKPYLQGNWLGTGLTDNPGARATFGVYKGGPVIYIREIH